MTVNELVATTTTSTPTIRAANRLCRLKGDALLGEFVEATRSLVGVNHSLVLRGPRLVVGGTFESPLALSGAEEDILNLLNNEVEFRRMVLRDAPRVHAELIASDVPFNPAVAPLMNFGLRNLYVYELCSDTTSQTFLLALDNRSALLEGNQLDALELLVSIVANSLGAETAITNLEVQIRELQYALNSRVVIEQAKGVLAERMKISPDAAFVHLRKLARDARSGLRATAMQVIHEGASSQLSRTNSVSAIASGNTGGHDLAL